MAPRKTRSTFRGFPLLFCLLLLLHLLTVTLASKCKKGLYYNAGLSKCIKCSECPLNQIVRQPCKQNEDKICGPFIEFKFSSFGQKDGDFNEHNLPSDAIVAGNRHGIRENKTKYMNSIEFSHLAVNGFGHLNVHNGGPNQYDTDRESGRRAVTNPRVEEYERITKEDSKYWRDLSFALIAVFCLIVLVATVMIWYLCRRCRLAGEHKITDEFDLDDGDSSYVVLHHFHPVRNSDFISRSETQTLQGVDSSNGIRQPLALRGKRIYRPKRRLLNEYADDVFESEDSAGSKTSRRYPLQVIPENERSDSEGKDSDEAGHSSELPSSENNDDTESQVKQSTAPVEAGTPADSSTLNGDQNNVSPAKPTGNCIIDV